MTWLTVPGIYLIYFLFIYLPQFIRAYASKKVRSLIMEQLGVTTVTRESFSDYVKEQLFGFIPSPLKVLLTIGLVLLIIVWFCACLVMTYRHFRYALAITATVVSSVWQTEKNLSHR